MVSLRKRALALPDVSDFGESRRLGKRFYVVYKGDVIHFGSDEGKAYVDHKNEAKKTAWYARHNQIYDRNNVQVINDPTSPSYYSARILWT